MDDLSGQEIRGYKLIERIGVGGMGEIYRAEQTSIDRRVAVKVILPEFAKQPDFEKRFEAEAQMVAKLEHPHIVPLYDYWREGERAYLVMRWLPGGSVRDVLEEGPLDLATAVRITTQISEALHSAHRAGVVHRDLKPGNILLDEDSNAYLTDFGIAKDVEGEDLTKTGNIVGSLDYLAPEQAKGEKVTPQTDIYGLGVLLFEMLTGAHPFPGLTAVQLIQKHLNEKLPSALITQAELPLEVDDIIQTATAKDPDERYESTLAFRDALTKLVSVEGDPGEKPVEAALPTFFEPDAMDRAERPVFVARERELETLAGFIDNTIAGKGGLAFVTGGAGRGKTALIDEFCYRIQEKLPDVVITRGSCNAHTGVGDPYLPFRDIMAMLSGDVEALWSVGSINKRHAQQLWEIMPRTVDAILTRGVSLIDIFAPGEELFSRIRAAVPGETNRLRRLKEAVDRKKAGTGELEQNLLFEQFTNVLQTLAKDHPLVLVLDDMQWADSASLDLLFHLGRRIEGHTILIVCAYRPEEVAMGRGEDRHPLENVVNELKRIYGDVVIDLTQEEEVQGKAFIEALLDSEPNKLGEEFRVALNEHTGGHPLFTIELLRAMQDRGDLIKDDDGQWIVGPDLSWDQLPARVEAVIEARLSRLEDDLRELLSVASVEGEDFTAQVVARVQEMKERKLLRDLSQELEKRHRLVREQGEQQIDGHLLSRYSFAHQLYQRYLYNDLAAGERRLLHGEIATVMEELFAEDADKIAVQLSVHFSHAGNKEKALHYLTIAGHQARARYAHQEAISFYTQALEMIPKDHPDRFELLHVRAKAHLLAGQYDKQLDDGRTMLSLAEKARDDAQRCDALMVQSDAFIETEIIYAGEPAQQAVEIARKTGDSSREAQALRRLGYYEWHRDRLPQAKQALEDAVALFEELDMPREAATCLHVLSLAYGSLSEFEPAFATVQKAVKLSHEAGDTVQEATGLRRIAVAYIQQSDHAEALPYAEQALELHRVIGDRGEEINALNVLGIIYAWIKEPKKSDQYLQEALDLGYEIGHGFGIRAPITNLVALKYRPYGNPEDWANFIDIHLTRAQEDEDELRVAYMNAFKAFALLTGGKIEEGIALMEYNIKELGDLAGPWEMASMHAYRSLGYTLLGEFDKAWECHEIAVQVSRDSGVRMFELMRIDEHAAIAWHQGEEKEMTKALAELEATMDEIRAIKETYTLCDRLEIAARMHNTLGDHELALKYSTEMLGLMEVVPGPYEPEVKYFTHAKALYGLKRDDEGDEFLKKARDRVTSIAEEIKDEELRRSWLEDVFMNREILGECDRRGIDQGM